MQMCDRDVPLVVDVFCLDISLFSIIRTNSLIIDSLLCSKVDKVRSHGVLLTAAELVHAEGRGGVLVGHLVPHAPPHVNNLNINIVSRGSNSALTNLKF